MAERRPLPYPKITATVAEFKEISGLGKNSIYDLLNSGRLRSVLIGRRRLIVIDSYRELVNGLQQPALGPHHPVADRGGERGYD